MGGLFKGALLPVELFWRLLDKRHAGLIIALSFCAIQFSIRLLAFENLDVDEAEVYLFPQSWQLFYELRHPPLQIWIMKAVLALTGDDPIGVNIWKYGALAGGLYAYYRAAYVLLESRALACVALLALLDTQTVRGAMHPHLSYSVILGTAISLSLLFLLRALKGGRNSDWIWLGVCLSLGLWTKYIFLFLVACFATATAAIPDLRARVSRRAALAIAGIVTLQSFITFGLAAIAKYSVTGLAVQLLQGGPRQARPSLIAPVWQMARAIWEFGGIVCAPFVPMANLIFGRASSSESNSFAANGARMIGLGCALALAGFLVFSVASHATWVRSQWLYPFLMLFPIALVYWSSRGVVPDLRMKAAALVLAAGAVLFIGFRIWGFTQPRSVCNDCAVYSPLQMMAHQLKANGFNEGTIIAPHYELAGNFRIAFRTSRIIAASVGPQAFGPVRSAPSKYILVWLGTEAPPEMRPYVQRALGLPGVKRGVIEVPRTERLNTRLSYVLVTLPTDIWPNPITGETQ